ncbi:hypothetical protein HED49_03385 [Ochrobactrum daejeonense]|nr:hypothetical protein [Brucella daejeonensis]
MDQDDRDIIRGVGAFDDRLRLDLKLQAVHRQPVLKALAFKIAFADQQYAAILRGLDCRSISPITKIIPPCPKAVPLVSNM